MRFLSYLLDILFPPRNTARLVLKATPASVAAIVQERTHAREGYAITTLLPYRHPLIRALIIQAKFGDDRLAATLLADVLRTHLTQRASGPRIIVPIPLSAERKRERGYNQVERVAALAVANIEGMTLSSSLLTRTRHTRPQTELTESMRSENVRHAFHAGVCDPHIRYLVIDDVITTGSTVHEAIQALTKAGATHIDVVALAH